MEEEKKDYPSKREAILVLIITFAILFLVSGIFSGTVSEGRKEGFLAEILVIIPALLFVYKRGYSIRKIFRLNRVSLNAILYSILIGISLLILSEEFERIMRIIFPLPEGISELEDKINELFKTSNIYEFLILFTAGVLMAGLFEEMLFRGFLLYSFEKHMDITRAVTLTAIMFTFVHSIWLVWIWYLIQITVLGVILGVLSWKSNSIYPPATVHILNNIISIYYTGNKDISIPSWLEWNGHISPVIVFLAGYFIILGFKCFYKICDKYKLNETCKRNKSKI